MASKRSYLSFLGLAALASFLSTPTQAAPVQFWNGNGGDPTDSSDTWDLGTPNWTGSAQIWSEAYDPSTGTVTGAGDVANFDTVGGTVTLDDSSGPVATDHLDFANNNGGAYILTSADLSYVLYTTGGYNGQMINVEGGSSAVTIDSNIDHVGADNQNIINSSSNDLTLNGTINYDNQTTLFVAANGSGKIIFNGAVTNASASGLYLTGGGTVEFGANADLTSLDSTGNGRNLSLVVANGTAVLDSNSIFLSTSQFQILGGNGILLNGSFVGTQSMTDEGHSGLLGGIQAVASGWTGDIYLDNGPPTQTFSQVAGGRFTYAATNTDLNNGGVHGNNLTYVVTSGDGTVILGAGNTYNVYTTNATTSGGVAYSLVADLTAKTTLITNGVNSSVFGKTDGGVALLEDGKTLGGTGYTGFNFVDGNGTHIASQKIMAVGPNSVIAPGDGGTDGGTASIGTLHLVGGLEADNGLTMNFKLTNPGVNDALDLGAGVFALSGNITVNLSAFGDFQNGTYTLASGTGAWTDNGATFAFTAPAGDSVTSYDFNTTTDQFTVTVAAPEPSTYALMGLGVLALVWFARRKSALI